MADLRQLLDSAAAREKLRAIPGVERIGFGLKERAGQVLPEYVFRVYVRFKKPLSELTPEEVIPAEIDGITTDVGVLHDTQPCCKTRIAPGMEISREAPNAGLSAGTLGCVVRKASRIFILTNEHVIVPQGSHSQSRDVYQPKHLTCAGLSCNSPVATVVGGISPWAFREAHSLGGRDFWLDCALVEINSEVAFANNIEGIGALAQRVSDLAAEPGSSPGPVSSVTLHKRGATTAVTHGTVVEFAHEHTDRGVTSVLWELVIRPTTGFRYSRTYRIRADEPRPLATILSLYAVQPVTATPVNPGDPGDRRIRFQGDVFLLPGDSGAICVNDAREACGLLHLASGFFLKVEGESEDVFVPTGQGHACHIRPVLLALELDPNNAIVVPSSPTSAPIMVTPGDGVVVGIEEGSDLEEEMERFEAALRATTAGRHLLDLFREHHRELFDLVNRRRPVTVSWQRNKGPAFVAAFLNVVRSGEREIPKRVAGFSIEDLISKMFAVLRQEGSDRLRQAIEEEGELLSLIVNECETFDQVMECLERERFAGAQMQP